MTTRVIENCPINDMVCHCRVHPTYPECHVKPPPPPPVPHVERVPTLAFDGLALMAVLLAVAGAMALRKRARA